MLPEPAQSSILFCRLETAAGFKKLKLRCGQMATHPVDSATLLLLQRDIGERTLSRISALRKSVVAASKLRCCRAFMIREKIKILLGLAQLCSGYCGIALQAPYGDTAAETQTIMAD